jgi:hypothetical protein
MPKLNIHSCRTSFLLISQIALLYSFFGLFYRGHFLCLLRYAELKKGLKLIFSLSLLTLIFISIILYLKGGL